MLALRTVLISAALSVSAISTLSAQDRANTFVVIERRATPADLEQVPTQMTEQQVFLAYEQETGEVDRDQVSAQMRTILGTFSDVFNETESRLGVALDEITLTLEVTAEGRVGLLGTGVSAGTTGGIRVVLRRPPGEP